ncbi:exonuclease VIII [Providencia rustigianii]|nr:exonuclease VIII [Providencia rustigianii]
MDAEQTIEIAQAVSEFADDEITIEDATALGKSYLKEEPKLEVTSATKSENDEPILKRDYATLDMEVALALIGDVDFDAIRSADIRKAKELIAAEDKAWKRLSMDLRTLPSVLDIPRENIFALVSEAREKPELFDDANARKAFIDAKLGAENPKVTSLGNGRFSVDNLGTKPANDEDPKEPVTKEKTRRGSKKKETPAKEEKEPETVAIETKETPAVTKPISAVTAEQDDFEHRATVIDEVLEGNNDHLSIWKRVQRTDARFTKPLEGMGFTGTSINSTYMFMRATEIFGPIGEGWGYEVIEEKFIDGKPLVEPVLDERNKQVATKFLRDSDGSLFCEQNHSLKIKFWYNTERGLRGEFESYGATPYRYQTNYGIKVDGEVIKKSLTDAIKKALSMLGFSSDVFMGMHDNPEYVASNKLEYEIKAATDNAEDTTRVRKELDEKFTRHTETMRSAVTANELRGITSTLTREISTHAKLAKQRGDTEYEKYLNGRLRRLKEIEDECLDQLKQKEEAI